MKYIDIHVNLCIYDGDAEKASTLREASQFAVHSRHIDTEIDSSFGDHLTLASSLSRWPCPKVNFSRPRSSALSIIGQIRDSKIYVRLAG